MSSLGSRKVRRGRSGQAAVEFALILPVLVLLIFGAIEFGRAYYELHLLTNAARAGARVGSLPEKVESDVSATVDAFLNNVGMPGTWTTTVVAEDSTGTARASLAEAVEGDHIAVAIAHDFSLVTGSVVPGVSGTIQLEGRCVFRRE